MVLLSSLDCPRRRHGPWRERSRRSQRSASLKCAPSTRAASSESARPHRGHGGGVLRWASQSCDGPTRGRISSIPVTLAPPGAAHAEHQRKEFMGERQRGVRDASGEQVQRYNQATLIYECSRIPARQQTFAPRGLCCLSPLDREAQQGRVTERRITIRRRSAETLTSDACWDRRPGCRAAGSPACGRPPPSPPACR